METFINMMIKRRKELNLTRYKLAQLTGINRMTLQKIENGEVKTPTLAKAVKIATVLDIDLNKLKGGN